MGMEGNSQWIGAMLCTASGPEKMPLDTLIPGPPMLPTQAQQKDNSKPVCPSKAASSFAQ
jgi:hypothetical protein